MDDRLVVRYAASTTPDERNELEARLGLIRIHEERGGAIAIVRWRGDRAASSIEGELLAAGIVVGTSRPLVDARGARQYSVPGELVVQFRAAPTEAACRARLRDLGATEVETSSATNVYRARFSRAAQSDSALATLHSDAEVAAADASPLARVEISALRQRTSGGAATPVIRQTGWDAELDAVGRERNPTVKQFVERFPGTWNVSVDQRTFGPSVVYGSGLPLSTVGFGPDARERVHDASLKFLRDNADVLRLEAYELRGEAREAGNTWIVHFAPTYDGLPLERHSRVTLGAKSDGGLAIVQIESIPVAVDSTVASVPISSAIEAALAVADATGEWLEVALPSLCILDDEGGVGRLAWTFTLRADDPAQPFAVEFYVAATGEGRVLHSESRVHRCGFDPQSAGSGGAIPATPSAATASCGVQPYEGIIGGDIWPASSIGITTSANFPDALMELIAYGSGSAYSDETGSAQLSLQSSDLNCVLQARSRLTGRWCTVHTASSMTCSVGSDLVTTALLHPSTSTFLYHTATTEFDLAQNSAYYWTSWAHDWSSARMNGNNGVERQMVANVNVCGIDNAAYYDGAVLGMRYARSTSGGCPNMAISDVVAHEYGHAIDDGLGGILNSSYSEGFGDAFAMAFTDQSIVGRGGCPHRDGNFVRLWTDVDFDGCPLTDTHCVGWVYGGFTWKLRLLLQAHLGTQIGADTADWLVLRPAIANPSSIPNALLWTFVVDDSDSDLTNLTPNYCDIVAAAVTRALPIPKLAPAVPLQPVVHYRFNPPSRGHDSAFDSAENPCPHDEVTGNADYDDTASMNGGLGAVVFQLGNGSDADSFAAHHKDDLDFVGLMTGMAWIKPSGNHDATPGCNWGTVMTKGGNYWFQINELNDGILFQNEGSGAPGTVVAVPASISTTGWTHVAFVRTVDGAPDPKLFPRSGGATSVRIYVNGADVGGGTTLAKAAANLWGLTLGYKPSVPTEACEFNGRIDELQIFPTALTQPEITAIYDAQKLMYP